MKIKATKKEKLENDESMIYFKVINSNETYEENLVRLSSIPEWVVEIPTENEKKKEIFKAHFHFKIGTTKAEKMMNNELLPLIEQSIEYKNVEDILISLDEIKNIDWSKVGGGFVENLLLHIWYNDEYPMKRNFCLIESEREAIIEYLKTVMLPTWDGTLQPFYK